METPKSYKWLLAERKALMNMPITELVIKLLRNNDNELKSIDSLIARSSYGGGNYKSKLL